MKKGNSGLTLIEVLVALALLSVLGIGILSLQYILSQNQVLVINSYKSVNDGNLSISNFVREVRTARTSDSGAYILERVNDQEIIFYSDINSDGVTEKVHYYLNGTNLIKGVIIPTGHPAQYPAAQEILTTLTPIVRNGATPVFYYYNADWPADTIHNPLPQSSRLSGTRMVQINLRLNTQPNQPDKDFILESMAQIRMLKTNL